MNVARNCGGSNPEVGFKIRIIDQVLDECPISSFDPEAAEVLRVVNMCEGEFGGQWTPSEVLEQTAYYHNVRSIILSEKGRIERWRKNKEERSKRK